VRETQGRTEFDEMPNGVRHIILLILGEGAPPIPEFVGEFDFPRHAYSMHPQEENSPARYGSRKFTSTLSDTLTGTPPRVPGW
jgi:hypothetical protein